METSARASLRVSVVEATSSEVRLSSAALASAAGISVTRLTRLVRLGVVEPLGPGADEFTAREASRLRRMLRLRADLGVNLIGAAVIVDLLERVERLETELGRAQPR